MTTCTPIYMLPYQDCSDRPCDAPGVWCDFAAAVEVQLDRLDVLINRTVDTIPQFEVSVGAYIFPVSSNRTVAFDTINVDTDNMVNLAEDPLSFPINTFGHWLFYFRVITNGDILIQGNIPVSVVNVPATGGLSVVQDYQDNGASYPVSIDGSGFYRYSTAGTRVSLNVGTAALSIVSATFGGYWLGDL